MQFVQKTLYVWMGWTMYPYLLLNILARKLRAIRYLRPADLITSQIGCSKRFRGCPITGILNSSKLTNVWRLPKSSLICDFINTDIIPVFLMPTPSKVAGRFVIGIALNATPVWISGSCHWSYVPSLVICFVHSKTCPFDFRKALDLLGHHIVIATLF